MHVRFLSPFLRYAGDGCTRPCTRQTPKLNLLRTVDCPNRNGHNSARSSCQLLVGVNLVRLVWVPPLRPASGENQAAHRGHASAGKRPRSHVTQWPTRTSRSPMLFERGSRGWWLPIAQRRPGVHLMPPFGDKLQPLDMGVFCEPNFRLSREVMAVMHDNLCPCQTSHKPFPQQRRRLGPSVCCRNGFPPEV